MTRSHTWLSRYVMGLVPCPVKCDLWGVVLRRCCCLGERRECRSWPTQGEGHDHTPLGQIRCPGMLIWVASASSDHCISLDLSSDALMSKLTGFVARQRGYWSSPVRTGRYVPPRQLHCIVFQYSYSAFHQPWANRSAFGSISSKKRDKF